MDDTYFNLLGNYNYTYWNESFSGSATKDHSFTNYTGSYAFNVGLEDLNFNNLQITTTNLSPDEAFKLQHSDLFTGCLLYTSPSPRDATLARMPSSA